MLKTEDRIYSKVNRMSKKILNYKNYNLEGVFIRFFISKLRRKKTKKPILTFHEILKNYLLNKLLIQSFIFYFSRFFLKFLSIKKKKVDFFLFANSEYKRNILENLFRKKINKTIVFQDYKTSFFQKKNKINIIPKYLFYQKPIHQDKIYNEIYNKINFFEFVIDFYEPKKVFLLEGDGVSDAIIAQICKKRNIACYCIQHGMKEPFFIPKGVNKWGFRGYFSDFIFRAENIFVINFLKKFNCLTKYEIVKRPIKKFLLRKKKVVIISPKFNKTKKENKKLLANIFLMIEFINLNYKSSNIIFRFHPHTPRNILRTLREKLKKFNITLHNPINLSPFQSIKDAKLLLMFSPSTFALDIMKFSKPLILLVDKKEYDTNLLKKNLCKICYSSNQMMHHVKNYINNKKL